MMLSYFKFLILACGVWILCCNASFSQDWYPVKFPSDTGLLGHVYSLYDFQNKLFVGGTFIMEINGTNTYSLVQWDGTKWDSLSIGIDVAPQNGLWVGGPVRSIKAYKNELYVCGSFDYTGYLTSKKIAKWDGTVWKEVGQQGIDVGGDLYVLEVYKDTLYLGGSIYTVDGLPVYCTVRWDSTNWSNVPGGDPSSIIFAYVVDKNDMYVGGQFWSAGGVNLYNVGRYDGSQWHAMELGTDGTVRSFAFDTVNNMLYVGGSFTNVTRPDSTNLLAFGIARWNGTNWDTLPGRIFYPVVFAQKIYHGLLCLGGGDTPGLALWDGKKEFSFGSLVWPTVRALEIYNDTLFVGGEFQYVVNQNGDTFYSPGLVKWWSSNYCDSVHAILNIVSDTVSVQNLHGFTL